MKLYANPVSTTSRPVLLFAAETGIALDVETIDLWGQQHLSAAYLAVNPNGLVPFLVDGDVALGESTAILRYLAAKSDSSAYPADLKCRARVDAAMGWFAGQFHTDFCLMSTYPRLGIPPGLDPALAKGMIAHGDARAPRWLTVLDRQMIGSRSFVCGDVITLADYLGAGFVTLGEAAAFDFSPYPNIRRWIGRMKALPHWEEVHGPFEAFSQAMRQRAA